MGYTPTLLLYILLRLSSLVSANPIPIETLAFFSTSRALERSWLFSWAWGPESTVSIVDRLPPLSFPSRPATFGLELSDPLLGYVIPLSSFTRPCDDQDLHLAQLSNNTGCPKLCVSGPSEPKDSENWIALVQRGDCPFVDKVREAQRLGAKAVVVGGDDPTESGNPDTLVNMFSQGDASDVNIAATFIKFSDYVTLSTLIAKSNTSHSGLPTLSLLITSEYSAWEWYSPIVTFIIILLLPSSLTFITLLLHRIRASRAAQRDRAPEEVVHHLPWRVYTGSGWEKHLGAEDPYAVSFTGESAAETALDGPPSPLTPVPEHEQPWYERQLECAICLSEFVKGDKVRVLPCHHIFHLEEVDEWLIKRKKVCPICKRDVTQPAQSAEDAGGSASPGETPLPPTPPPSERTPLLHHD